MASLPPGPNNHPMKLRSGNGGKVPRSRFRNSKDSSQFTGTADHASSYSSVDTETPQTHITKEHYFKKTQHFESSGGDNYLVSQLLANSQLGSNPLLQTKKTSTSVVQRKQTSSSAAQQSLLSISGYSSGYDTTEEREKTDYTYARSFTYRSQVTPNRECPSPNMSRTALYRFPRNYSYLNSDDDEEDIFHSLKTKLDTSHLSSTRTEKGIQDNTNTLWSAQVSSTLGSSSNHPLARSPLSSTIQHQEFSTVRKWLRFFSWSEEGSRSRRSCLPLVLFLLLATAGSALLWAGHPYLVNSTTIIHQMFTPPVPQPVFNTTTTTSSREEIQSLVHHILQQQLGKRDSRLDQLDYNLATIHASLQTISQGLKANLETSQASCSRSQAQSNQTSQQLKHLENQVETLMARLAELKNCCSNSTEALQSLEQSMGQLLVDVMDSPSHPFARWLQHKFVLRPEPERRVEEGTPVTVANVSDLRSLVWSTVHQALAQYDADKTGQADYALESAGGSVVSTRCSEAYQDRSAQFSVFGIPLWHFSHSPRKVIQPGVSPGECWPFRGSQGYLVIQLSAPVTPTAFTLEHIPASLSPSGHIDSAPRRFTVLGLSSEKETEGVMLGHYTYDITKEPLQTFPVQHPNPAVFPFIELRIESNHGNLEYTCLYRFRVHGIRSNL